MQVKIKKVNPEIQTVIPKYAIDGDAGLDLVATSKECDGNGNIVYGTNLAVQIPTGFVGLLFPRSSISKYDLSLANSVGVIDSNYRGEIMLKMKALISQIKLSHSLNSGISRTILNDYNIGDRIAQLIIMPYPKIELELVEELDETERGNGGFGHTGK